MDRQHLKKRCGIADADEFLLKPTYSATFGRSEDAIACCEIGASLVPCLWDSDPCMVFLYFPLGQLGVLEWRSFDQISLSFNFHTVQ